MNDRTTVRNPADAFVEVLRGSSDDAAPAAPARAAAFTLIELLVVVAIIAVLMAMLLPALNRARDVSRGLVCATHNRQCTASMLMFGLEHDQYLAPLGHAAGWQGLADVEWWFHPRWLGPYLGGQVGLDPKVIRCPSAKSWGIGYNHAQIGRWLSVNSSGVSTREFQWQLSDIARPAETVCFVDAGTIGNVAEPDPDAWLPATADNGAPLFRNPNDIPSFDTKPTRAVNRHAGQSAAGFADGSVRLQPIGKLGFQFGFKHPLATWDRY